MLHRYLQQFTLILVSLLHCNKQVNAVVFFPRGGSFGYLAAVAMPLDLPNRNVYMAFNFESNYGLPSNDSYNEWIDRWNLDEEYLGIGNDITAINGRKNNDATVRHVQEEEEEQSEAQQQNEAEQQQKPEEQQQSRSFQKQSRSIRGPFPRYDRRSFYRLFTGYLNLFQMNGTGCLLRTICEVAASKSLHENNGILGSIIKILFMPTLSEPEIPQLHADINDEDLYRAEWQGQYYGANNNIHLKKQQHHDQQSSNTNDHNNFNEEHITNMACLDYIQWCPEGVINMISDWY